MWVGKKKCSNTKRILEREGLNTDLNGLPLFWLIWESAKIITALVYNSLKKCKSKNIKKIKFFFKAECQLVNLEEVIKSVS